MSPAVLTIFIKQSGRYSSTIGSYSWFYITTQWVNGYIHLKSLRYQSQTKNLTIKRCTLEFDFSNTCSRTLTNAILILHQVGILCVYMYSINTAVKSVVDEFNCDVLSLRAMISATGIFFILITFVPNLQMFGFFSAVALTLTMICLSLVFFQIFTEDRDHAKGLSLVGTPTEWTKFVDIMMFSMFAVGTVSWNNIRKNGCSRKEYQVFMVFCGDTVKVLKSYSCFEFAIILHCIALLIIEYILCCADKYTDHLQARDCF